LNNILLRAICFALLVIIFAMFPLFATTQLQPSFTNAIGIEGFIIQSHSVTINPLSENTSYGMPFSIMGDDVKEATDKTTGRRIATWTLESTYSPLSVSIKATPLVHITGSTSIEYYISFKYSYEKYDDNGDIAGLEENFILVSTLAGEVSITLNNQSSNGQIYPIKSLSQDVKFMLHSYTDSEKDAWAGGSYIATVTITISGG